MNKMVNEKAGKKYKPQPVYNRKMLRSIIRNNVSKKFGNHKVSAVMSANFKRIRKGEE